MMITCPACHLNLGDNRQYTVEQAIREHVCLASDEEHQQAITRVKFQQIVSNLNL